MTSLSRGSVDLPKRHYYPTSGKKKKTTPH